MDDSGSDSDLRVWPIYPAISGDMLLRPSYPVETYPVYISLSQLATFFVAPSIDVVVPNTGDVVVLVGDTFVDTSALASLTLRLPAAVDNLTVEICFAAPVTTLTVQDAVGGSVVGSPVNAYGPGAAIEFKCVPTLGWR